MDETRRVLIADAFGTEPMGGRRVAVVAEGDGLDPDAIADELGAPTALLDREDGTNRLRAVGGSVTTAAIGAYGGFGAVGELDAGTYAVETDEDDRSVEVVDGGAWVEATLPAWEPASDDGRSGAGEHGDGALGVDAAERLDFPVGVAGGRTVVGAGYLSALEASLPAGVVAFTFETLAPDAHVYVRSGSGPAGPTDCAAVVAALDATDAFDGEFPERVRCETGRLAGRPGEVWVDSAGRVGGPVSVSLTGELRVDGRDDDILVA